MKNEQLESIESVLDKVKSYTASTDFELVEKAYGLARASCDSNPKPAASVQLARSVTSAFILASLKTHVDTVAAALMVNLPEVSCPLSLIEERVGESVANLVQEVRNIRRLPYLNKKMPR